MHQQRLSARAEFRLKENQRVKDSASLSEKFRKLKTLKVELAYHNAGSENPSRQIKYTVNLDHAKSVFRFDCNNAECVRGDFDLSAELAKAVAGRKKIASGEKCCAGWRNKETIGTTHCNSVLRYKLTLGYA